MTVAVAAALSLVIYLACGVGFDRLAFRGVHRRDPLTEFVSVLMFGYVGLGGLVLIAGQLRLVYQQTFLVLVGLGVVVIVAERVRCWHLARFVGSSIWLALRRVPLLCVGAAATYALSEISTVRGIINPDERDYKWRTPLLVAAHHQFVDTNTRLSNGVFLEQLFVIPAATFHSLHAARVLQTLAVVLAVTSCAAVTRRLGGNGLLGAFAALSCFILPIHLREIGDDILVAALLMSTLALLLSPDAKRRSTVVAGIAFAAAVAAKVYVIALAPMFLVALLVLHPAGIRRAWASPQARILVLSFLAPLVCLVMLTVAHNFSVTGHAFKETSPHLEIYPSGSRQLRTGEAAGRIPSLRDLVMIPIVPFFSGVHGGEPYGTRAGIVFAVALPVTILGAFAGSRDLRRRVLIPLLIGGAAYLILAPVYIKTRFLLFSWLCVFAAADILITSWRNHSKHRAATIAWISAQVVILAAFADAIRLLYERLPP